MVKSEITQFREQQALHELAAQQGLSGLAMVASHASINALMARGAERMLQLLSEGRSYEAIALMERPDWGANVEGTTEVPRGSRE